MPVVETVGPLNARQPLPPPAAGREQRGAAQASARCRRRRCEWNAEVERETAHALRAHQERRAVGRVAVLRALRERHQRAEEGAQRRHPGAQLPDAGDLQLRRRFRRQLAPARARGHQGQGRRDRAVRRALHGRDREDPEPRQDRADPGPAGRLLARLLDHRRGRAAAARALPGRAGRDLRQHLGRGEGRERHHLHVVERAAGGREPRRRQGDLRARPVSGEIRRLADQGEDHRLEGLLRGARALHRRRAGADPRQRSGRCRSSRIRSARRT